MVIIMSALSFCLYYKENEPFLKVRGTVNKHIQITSKAKNSGICSEIVSSIVKFSNTASYFYGSYRIASFNMRAAPWITNPHLTRGMSSKSYKSVIKPYSEDK